MSVPDPRANPILLGHEAAEVTLLEALRGGRLHHAWLITGPEGVGKATLAYRFARRLLAGAPAGNSLALDPSHPVFRRVKAGSHADLLTIERGFDIERLLRALVIGALLEECPPAGHPPAPYLVPLRCWRTL